VNLTNREPSALDGVLEKRHRIARALRGDSVGSVRLSKPTSNLFRNRQARPAETLDARDFDQVLGVDTQRMLVETEGATSYAKLVQRCLHRDVMPAVVPQLKSITIGGAVAGVGIESSSFRHGLVHQSVREMEVLIADGSTVLCRADNEHRDLFAGLPNSYGTLGYVLRLVADVIPVKPYVQLTHLRYTDATAFFDGLRDRCRSDVDFVDGVVFGRAEYYLTLGQFRDEAPYTSDYTYEHIYYRSIRERHSDFLTTHDYLWRWDTDWFWCSKNLFAQNPLVRRVLGQRRLNSVTYTAIMRWNNRWKLTSRLNRLLGYHTESVIQDVDIPLDRCVDFLDFYLDKIRFTPIWICPIGPLGGDGRFPLYPLEPGTLYVNFGFWDVIRERTPRTDGHYNRMVEAQVRQLGGIKSLYSESYFTPEEFWGCYERDAYEALKRRYDPQGRFGDLYGKCVLRQ
jgi:FAD/FMN-containing dehydrogenase